VQFAADGSQPLELSRTMSWHYVNFNLTAWGRIAEVGKNLAVDRGRHLPRGGGRSP